MSKKHLNFIVGAILVSVAFLCGCPIKSHRLVTGSNPPFFSDQPPAKGQWKVTQKLERGFYAKVYAHKKLPVLIIAAFSQLEGVPPADMTDPRNQQIMAEHALKSICAGVKCNCSVQSSDIAWILGSPLKYIYVRFKAEKPGYPLMMGLLYYRFDPPLQTMYLLMASENVFSDYEDVFMEYVGNVRLNPGAG